MSVSVVPTLDMERAIAASGYDVIVGFDEVGRGSLAGPVMVGAAAIRTCDLAGSSTLQVPDGVAIDETSYIRSGVDPSSFAFSEKVTAGHVFVMGDNRANSADSRYHQDDSSHGLVPVSDVVGVGLVKYWPLNHISTLDAHHDVFRDVPEGSAD